MICTTEKVFGFPRTPKDTKDSSKQDWGMEKAPISTSMQMYSRVTGSVARLTVMGFLMVWKLFMKVSGKTVCPMVRESTSSMTPRSMKVSLWMENLTEGENIPINFCATKGCSKRACSTEKEWSFTSPVKLLKVSSIKTLCIKAYTSTSTATYMKANFKTMKNQAKVSIHLLTATFTKEPSKKASAVVTVWWPLPIATLMKDTGKQEWNMERVGIPGLIRLCMRVVSGWTKDKEKEKSSILMPAGMKGTGEMIREKARECSFRTILLSGFSTDILELFILL